MLASYSSETSRHRNRRARYGRLCAEEWLVRLVRCWPRPASSDTMRPTPNRNSETKRPDANLEEMRSMLGKITVVAIAMYVVCSVNPGECYE